MTPDAESTDFSALFEELRRKQGSDAVARALAVSCTVDELQDAAGIAFELAGLAPETDPDDTDED